MEHQRLTHRGYTIAIHTDEEPDDPRDWSNVGRMVTWHPRYTLGDEQVTRERMQELADEHGTIEAIARAEYGAVGPVLPLWLIDHSGLAMQTGPFREDAGGWDSGVVGFTFATAETLEECGTPPEHVEEALTDEVKAYDAYLRGECYGYVIRDGLGEVVESLWAIYDYDYYGQDDLDACYLLREARDAVDYLADAALADLDRWAGAGGLVAP